jgi:hypothetical protein
VQVQKKVTVRGHRAEFESGKGSRVKKLPLRLAACSQNEVLIMEVVERCKLIMEVVTGIVQVDMLVQHATRERPKDTT